MNGSPLPLSVALAREVEGQWSGEAGHVERDAARIDAKVRPLAEALWRVTRADYHRRNAAIHDARLALEAAGIDTTAFNFDAALKSAGAE